MNIDDVISFLMAGASAVQIGSATFVDPYTIPKVIAGVGGYLEKNGYSGIQEITGITHG
jgi:dihydroorotate dehydrogenase (NAD+) catalytic subunit